LKFYPILSLRHPAFVEWLKLSLPMMVGVSLAMADKWILSYFAAADPGGISRLNNAKALFNAPLVIVAAAAGSASLPFFSALFSQGKMYEFNDAVNRSVSRLLAVAFLLSALMSAMSGPIVDLLRGGRYTPADAAMTANYFGIFALSLAFWSAQGIYARAFYAARNTLVPAISGTVVTCVSIPVYAVLFHHVGVPGLAIASNLGIVAHTVALAILLHKYRLVSIACLEWGELGRAAIAAGIAYFVISLVAGIGVVRGLHGYGADAAVIAAGTVIWGGLVFGVLQVTGSKLVGQLLRRSG
jgi:putative peptidoglycan lipid II flippase